MALLVGYGEVGAGRGNTACDVAADRTHSRV